LHSSRLQASSAKVELVEDKWPKELLQAAADMEAARKAATANPILVPEIEYEPKHDAGQLAVKIFHSAYAMKFDLNQIEADLVDFVAEIEATPEAKPIFVEAPDWDAAVLKDIQLSTIKDLTYGENTKTILRAVVEEGAIYKLIPAMKSLKRIMRGYRDEHTAVLTTARPLADHEVKFYSNLFAQQYLGGEAKLELNTLVDPSILGGFKLSIDDGEQVIDRSYASELAGIEQLEESIMRNHFTTDRRVAPRSL